MHLKNFVIVYWKALVNKQKVLVCSEDSGLLHHLSVFGTSGITLVPVWFLASPVKPLVLKSTTPALSKPWWGSMGISHQRAPVFSQLYLTLLFITDSIVFGENVYSHPRHYCLRGRRTSQPCLYPEAVFSAPESPLNRTTCSGYNVPVLFLRFKHLGSTTPTSKAAHDHTLCQLLQKPARIATLRRVLVMFRSRFPPPPPPPPPFFFFFFVFPVRYF